MNNAKDYRGDLIYHWLLGDIMQICTQELNSFDIIILVKLFVDGMCTVSRAAHWKKKNVLARGLLQRNGYRDTNGRSANVIIRECDK